MSTERTAKRSTTISLLLRYTKGESESTMSDDPLTYARFVNYRLAQLNTECGDVLETRYSALVTNPSRQMGRAIEAFLEGFHFVPEEIVMNPSILPERLRHIHHLDVFLVRTREDVERISQNALEGMAVLGLAMSGILANAQGLPTKIGYSFDETMDPGSVAARYTIPLCEACTFKKRYLAAITQQDRDAILEQALQSGGAVVINGKGLGEEESQF